MSSQQRTANDGHRADPVDKATSDVHGYVDRGGPAAARYRHHENAGHEIVDVWCPSRHVTEPVAERPTEDVVEQQKHHDRHEYRAHDQQAEEPDAVLDFAPEHGGGVLGGEGQGAHWLLSLEALPVTAKNTSSRSGVWMDRSSTATWSPRRASTSRRGRMPRSFGTRSSSSSSSRVPSGISRAASASEAESANRSRICAPGMRRFSSSGVPSATMRPWSSTAMRSARWSASSRYWVVSKMVTPSCTSSRMICHIVWRLRGSRPVVGSSRKISRGCPIRVIARSRRRFIPPA